MRWVYGHSEEDLVDKILKQISGYKKENVDVSWKGPGWYYVTDYYCDRREILEAYAGSLRYSAFEILNNYALAKEDLTFLIKHLELKVKTEEIARALEEVKKECNSLVLEKLLNEQIPLLLEEYNCLKELHKLRT